MIYNNVALPTNYQSFIHASRYARWKPELGRRETWNETVDRYIGNVVAPALHKANVPYENLVGIQNELREAILLHDVLPSMRCLMTAGPALDRDNTAGYNCSYTPVDDKRVFDEVLYILMCGTGVGYSVEKKYTSCLPKVPDMLMEKDLTIGVEDSKEGWADAYRQLIEELYTGSIPHYDVSKVRPAGARLKTFGGRASGAQPLVDLFGHTIEIFHDATGRQLKPVEVHSIMCKIGEVVVVGGVRRSAMISLSDLDDQEMRDAKAGEWWQDNPHYALANNSVAYETKPTAVDFMGEWISLAASGSGERGIFNREAARSKCEAEGTRDPDWEFGTNPCSEIVLRGAQTKQVYNLTNEQWDTEIIPGTGGQFCNLSTVVVRAQDTAKDLRRKIRLAAILGTLQATLTNFPYLRSNWQRNTAEEALLGVSMTGIMDNLLTSGGHSLSMLSNTLRELRKEAEETNKEWAYKLGINPAAAVTCVKPEGTSSQLTNSASGIHPRHSEYYIRTVRADVKDPITNFMIDQGIPHEPCVMKPESTVVFSFPQKAPDNAITRHDMTAIDQLELWLIYQRDFCSHKPSITVSVSDEEWPEVGAWVYKHFDEMSGVSFLPKFEHTYQQAPYQDCTEEEYNQMFLTMPAFIDWDELSNFEKSEDTTRGTQTLACTGEVCEIVDIEAAA
jgi:ribonucleoside-diphosphate reductase alpha chain